MSCDLRGLAPPSLPSVAMVLLFLWEMLMPDKQADRHASFHHLWHIAVS